MNRKFLKKEIILSKATNFFVRSSFLFLFVLMVTASPVHAGPAAALQVGFNQPSQITVSNQGNMNYRLWLTQPLTAGPYTCNLVYFEGSESASSQKWQLMLGAYMTRQPLVFTIDGYYPNSTNFCHATEVSM